VPQITFCYVERIDEIARSAREMGVSDTLEKVDVLQCARQPVDRLAGSLTM